MEDYAATLNHHQALAIFQPMNLACDEGWLHLNIARIKIKLQKPYKAKKSYQRAIQCFESAGMDNLAKMCRQEMQLTHLFNSLGFTLSLIFLFLATIAVSSMLILSKTLDRPSISPPPPPANSK